MHWMHLDRRQRVWVVLMVTMIVAGSAAALWLRLSRPRVMHIDVDRAEYPVKGVDVSQHNGPIDWDDVRDDTVTFAYIRASMGSDGRDTLWEANYQGALDAYLLVGAYHYFRHNEDGLEQADNFLRAIGDARLHLPLAIDVEDPVSGLSPAPPSQVTVELQRMVQHLRLRGYRVVLYSNKKGYQKYLRGHFQPEDADIWICSFTLPPLDEPYTLWQHSHEGDVEGISHDTDLDAFHGDVRQFVVWAHGARGMDNE